MVAALSDYSWYEDDELLALLDRYVGRSPDGAGAGRRLKVWLARGDGSTTLSTASAEAAGVQSDDEGLTWLTRDQAAARAGISPKTLANYGENGPSYETWPFVRYRRDVLDAWIRRRKDAPSRRGRPRRQ